MADRMIDLRVPADLRDDVRDVIEEADPDWYEHVATDDSIVFRLVLDAPDVEAFLDRITELCGEDGPTRALVLSVVARSPRSEAKEDEEDDDSEGNDRVSRDELYEQLEDAVEPNRSLLILAALSALVSAIGLARDSAAVVIGAMVIAPLLSPNMALALATTLADPKLARRAALANLVGIAVAALVACAAGWIWRLAPLGTEVLQRTSVSLSEVALALASGAAGALATTRGTASSLVGVMVAVSLLPPLVIACMLGVQGQSHAAGQAALLLLANVVCVNLAAVTVFRLRGIRPRDFYEEERAAKATRLALGVWIVLLASVAALIAWTGSHAPDAPVAPVAGSP